MTQLQDIEIGSRFEYGGRSWILLDRREDRHLCISENGEGSRQYDGGIQARFDKAAIGRWLNGEYYEALLSGGASAADFTPVLMNLANHGEADCVHGMRVGLLSWRQWFTYSDRIPPIYRWQWTCSISDGIRGAGLMCMAGSGRNGYAYYPPNHPDPIVRPAVSLVGYAEVRS